MPVPNNGSKWQIEAMSFSAYTFCTCKYTGIIFNFKLLEVLLKFICMDHLLTVK